jgi:hypothetical protein
MRSRKNRSITKYCVTQINEAKVHYYAEEFIFIFPAIAFKKVKLKKNARRFPKLVL